jgi:hypothetical protein
MAEGENSWFSRVIVLVPTCEAVDKCINLRHKRIVSRAVGECDSLDEKEKHKSNNMFRSSKCEGDAECEQSYQDSVQIMETTRLTDKYCLIIAEITQLTNRSAIRLLESFHPPEGRPASTDGHAAGNKILASRTLDIGENPMKR